MFKLPFQGAAEAAIAKKVADEVVAKIHTIDAPHLVADLLSEFKADFDAANKDLDGDGKSEKDDIIADLEVAKAAMVRVGDRLKKVHEAAEKH